jgi:hypothetical protein
MARSSSTAQKPTPTPSTHPEHWSASAGTRDVARLDIPPDAHRDRTFEVFVSLAVHNRAERPGATHALRVLVNGALEWQRTVPTHPGPGDTLDLRLKRVVPLGQALRLTATSEVAGAVRISLKISADEA